MARHPETPETRRRRVMRETLTWLESWQNLALEDGDPATERTLEDAYDALTALAPDDLCLHERSHVGYVCTGDK